MILLNINTKRFNASCSANLPNNGGKHGVVAANSSTAELSQMQLPKSLEQHPKITKNP